MTDGIIAAFGCEVEVDSAIGPLVGAVGVVVVVVVVVVVLDVEVEVVDVVVKPSLFELNEFNRAVRGGVFLFLDFSVCFKCCGQDTSATLRVACCGERVGELLLCRFRRYIRPRTRVTTLKEVTQKANKRNLTIDRH